MIATALLCLTAAFTRTPTHEVEKFDGFELQAVAFLDPSGKYLYRAVRPEGKLPADGVWCLKTNSVTLEDGSPVPVLSKMTGAIDVKIGLRALGLSPLKTPDSPARLKLVGELVHYRDVEEQATFPKVHLESYSPGRPEHPHFRDWFVPKAVTSTATTPSGLVLHFARVNGWGYSGPGYDDLARLPVTIDAATLNSGVSKELGECHQKSVDRVDAYDAGNRLITVYQPDYGTQDGTFTYCDKEFSQDVQLSLHVIRRIIDRSYPFSFIVPVQKDKSLDEEHRSMPDPSRIVVWPSSARPKVPDNSNTSQP